MQGRRSKVSLALFVGLAFLARAAEASAQSYRLEPTSGGPPEELAAAVRETLAAEGLRVVGPNGPWREIWLRKILPAKASAAPQLDITFPQLAEGTLVGAVRFLSEAKDYRRQSVKPGVYTLRYALHPIDGNHYAVARQRDFLLLVPAAEDATPGNLAVYRLLALSRKASGTSHPLVWSLERVEGEAVLPRVYKQEENYWVLQFSVKLQSEAGAVSDQHMGLVIVGASSEA